LEALDDKTSLSIISSLIIIFTIVPKNHARHCAPPSKETDSKRQSLPTGRQSHDNMGNFLLFVKSIIRLNVRIFFWVKNALQPNSVVINVTIL